MKELIPINDLIELDELVHKSLSNSENIEENLLSFNEFINEHPKLSELYWISHCIKETIMHWFMLQSEQERDVYSWVCANAKNIFPQGYRIIKKKNNPKHIPDFWISNNKHEIPVECKLKVFDKKALEQLKRYMCFYNCDRGIAIAKKLSVELPSSITFIKYGGE